MARKLNKSLATSTINVLDPTIKFELDSNGMPKPNRTLTVDGNVSDNKARILAQNKFGKNVLVISVTVNEISAKLDTETFLAHSQLCISGNTYGRDTITLTFKLTHVIGFCVNENGMQQFDVIYNGTSTANKLRNYACKILNSQNVVVTETKVVDERRYMTRDKYAQLAKSAQITEVVEQN